MRDMCYDIIDMTLMHDNREGNTSGHIPEKLSKASSLNHIKSYKFIA